MKILFTLFTFLAFSIGANAKIITLECKEDKLISTYYHSKTNEQIFTQETANKRMQVITLDTDNNSASIEYPNLDANMFPSHSATLYKNSSHYWFSYPAMIYENTLTKTSIDRTNLNIISENNIPLNPDGIDSSMGEEKSTGNVLLLFQRKL